MTTNVTRTWLVSGPPGCGKSSWILKALQEHAGPCGYLRLAGFSDDALMHADDGCIDLAYLQDQVPGLRDLTKGDLAEIQIEDNFFALIELPQFKPPDESGLEGIDPRVMTQLRTIKLQPDRALHFGQDEELPQEDTLEFTRLEAWSMSLEGCVWDPNSLSSFWFELVNGAYGDVYRAKALMNLPDGRAFFCNWMVSQGGSQFLPLESVAPPNGRPKRCSRLSVQGKALDGAGIQATIADCLLSDEVLELHQEPQRQQAELTQAL